MSRYAGQWDVSVNNLGFVMRSTTEAKARKAWIDYEEQADAHRFRASHPVVLWHDGEPVKESAACAVCERDQA